MTFTALNAILTMYKRNFKLIHWGAIGPKFDRMHTISENYASMLEKDIDEVAEMGLRCNENPVNIDGILKELEKEDGSYIMLEFKSFTYTEFTSATDKMFAGILKAIAELRNSSKLQEDSNMGIKASLESMYDRYDLQYRYLNDRRKHNLP